MATLPGIRKAALLLMGLDPPTAAELLKTADPEVVTRIAAELAYLQASGDAKREIIEQPVREFFHLLRGQAETQSSRFLREILDGVLGREKSREILSRIRDLVDQRDPFLAIRSADPQDVAEALKEESPYVASLVLAELPPNASAKLLPLLSEEVRAEAIRSMTREETVSSETRARVAAIVRRKLTRTEITGGGKTGRHKQLRRVALLLRGLGGELRSALLQAIAQSDEHTSVEVQNLMVMWEDIPIVSDRSLQEGLRSVDSRKLALATVNAEEITVRKLRGNMSERQAGMLDEEISLLSAPKQDQIDDARGEFLGALRDLAANNLLTFEDQ